MTRPFKEQNQIEESTGNRGFSLPHLSLSCLLLSALLLVTVYFGTASAYADLDDDPSGKDTLIDKISTDVPNLPESKEGDDSVDDAEVGENDPASATEGISLSLSEPEIWQEGDMVFYRTILTAEDTRSFFGYQIEVEASGENNVEVNGLYDGLKTDSVYKNSNLYLASMNTTISSGDISACEIIVKYPKADVSDDNQLVVRTFQAVTSISPETIVSFGPEPAAAVLNLPAPTDTFNWLLLLLILLCIVAIALTTWYFVRKSKSKNPAEALH